MSVQIESDLKEFLTKFEQRFDKIDNKLDKLSEDVTELKVSQARLEDKIEVLDTKIEQLDKRVGNQEFTNCGVLVGLVVVILGGFAKLYGMIGNP